MASDAQNALAAALDRMWLQYLPLMRERVAILESAARDFAAGNLSIERQEEASAAAHKLAGVCGTFGLTRATVLARELEIMYTRQNGPDPELAQNMTAIAAELRTLIESRK
jgi:HPt (histidine-containing phosphotransfer) domain-containing protein